MRQVLDLRPGGASSSPRGVTGCHDRVFFRANVGVLGDELWVSDGTAAGTRSPRDIHAGAASSGPTEFAAVGDRVWFAANDGAALGL